MLHTHDEDDRWKTGNGCTSLFIFTNARGPAGFLFLCQWYFYKDRCVETVLGYKVPWENERKNRAMVAVRFTIKRYQKQEV